MAMPMGVLAMTRPFKGGAWEMGAFSSSIVEKVQEFKLVKTEAREEEVKKRVFNYVSDGDFSCEYAKEHDPCENHPNYELLELLLCKSTMAPIFREAGFSSDLTKIQQILAACSRYNLDSANIRGSHGETPLQTAAATGNTQIIEFLLDRRAMRNIQDDDGETPLHYANLQGKLRL